ncbi:glutathione peroxidase [Chitinimonas sp. BJB300]|uniref:glutathione peroxidase n=1 Tax=Chitinimonas sp. BJB300 TaxID=1559339 RepID=UPI000C0D4C00|nr:glutathione peroxidase [Chitinimonas sp. BJB300]PHV12287.1 glutathione peroxidase [Chitinimonas sp. BJB300]TSJ88148.1 glutathione peroxidase [Chitinimonas sp. BJB300]
MVRSSFCAVLLMTAGVASAADCTALLKHEFKTLQGQPLNLCGMAGKPILVVNTASKCGYTRQFETLEAMYKQYKAQGLMVVGFPSNDFKQELASNKEIGDFCKLTYFIEFPMAEASSVKGESANPFFKALALATGEAPKWNFQKYLIAPDGKTVYAFSTPTEPDAPELMSKLKPMLKPTK